MKKALHILRKDSVQQAVPLVVWLLFLIARLRIDTLPIPSNGNLGLAAMMGAFLTFAGFSVLAVLVAAVSADPLGNQEAFYRTRPIRTRDIVLAKILFLVLWITLPVVGFECVYLFLQNAPVSLLVGSVIERSLFVTLIGIIIGASATTFPSATAWGRTVLACLPIPWAVAFLLAWLRDVGSFAALTPTHTSATGFVFQLTLLALAFSLYAWRSLRKIDSWKRRYATHALIVATVPLCNLQWQASLGRVTALPASQSTPLAASIEPSRITVSTHDHGQRTDLAQIQVSLTPSVSGPEATSMSWSVSDLELRTETERDLNESHPRPNTRLFYFRGSSSSRSHDLSAIGSLLPAGIRLIQTFHGQWPASQNTTAGISTKKSVVTAEKPVQLLGKLVGNHYTWRLVGELPLQAGAAVRDEGEAFHFVQWREGRNSGFNITVQWGRPSLNLTRDQNLKRFSDKLLDRHEFVLIQPEEAVAYLPESSFGQVGSGLLTAYQRSNKTLEFQATNRELKLPPLDPTTARLAIFKKIYHGNISLDWHKDNVVLAQQYSPTSGGNLRTAQTLSRQEFHRRMTELGDPPQSGSRAEAGRYLYAVIKLVQARDEWIRERDSIARRLAPLAKQHPEMFLEGLRTAHHRASQLLDAVLPHAMEKEHLAVLLKYLPEQPGLAELIVKRGWHEAARKELVQLAHQRSNLPIGAVRAILILEDESTYAPLLADFERNPTIYYYDALRTVPSLYSSLDEIVHKLWSDRPKILTHNLSGLQILNIAMRHGLKEPIHEIYNILQWVDRENFSNEYTLSRPIKENVVIEELRPHERNNSNDIFRWMLQQKPEWYHYDPARRRFIIKKA